MMFVLSLDPPIMQGKTRYLFLILLFNRKDHIELELPISQSELASKYGGRLQKKMSGPVYQVFGSILQSLINTRILKSDESFTKSNGDVAEINCTHKVNYGMLYPLENGFIYLHKPPIHIRFDEISSITFFSGGIPKFFDFEIITKGGANHVFTSIAEKTYTKLYDFVKTKGLPISGSKKKDKMALDSDILAGDDDDDSESEDEDFDPDAFDEEDISLEFDSDASVSSEDDSDSDDEPPKKENPKKETAKKETKEKRSESIKLKDLVKLDVVDADLDDAAVSKKSFLTDGEISQVDKNRTQERELVPWNDGDGDSLDTAHGSSFSNNGAGWNANEMLEYNQRKYNIKSTFDNDLYSIPLENRDDDEFKKQQAHAEAVAREIEGDPERLRRLANENEVDEETRFSAVISGKREYELSAIPGKTDNRNNHDRRPSNNTNNSNNFVKGGAGRGQHLRPNRGPHGPALQPKPEMNWREESRMNQQNQQHQQPHQPQPNQQQQQHPNQHHQHQPHQHSQAQHPQHVQQQHQQHPAQHQQQQHAPQHQQQQQPQLSHQPQLHHPQQHQQNRNKPAQLSKPAEPAIKEASPVTASAPKGGPNDKSVNESPVAASASPANTSANDKSVNESPAAASAPPPKAASNDKTVNESPVASAQASQPAAAAQASQPASSEQQTPVTPTAANTSSVSKLNPNAKSFTPRAMNVQANVSQQPPNAGGIQAPALKPAPPAPIPQPMPTVGPYAYPMGPHGQGGYILNPMALQNARHMGPNMVPTPYPNPYPNPSLAMHPQFIQSLPQSNVVLYPQPVPQQMPPNANVMAPPQVPQQPHHIGQQGQAPNQGQNPRFRGKGGPNQGNQQQQQYILRGQGQHLPPQQPHVEAYQQSQQVVNVTGTPIQMPGPQGPYQQPAPGQMMPHHPQQQVPVQIPQQYAYPYGVQPRFQIPHPGAINLAGMPYDQAQQFMMMQCAPATMAAMGAAVQMQPQPQPPVPGQQQQPRVVPGAQPGQPGGQPPNVPQVQTGPQQAY